MKNMPLPKTKAVVRDFLLNNSAEIIAIKGNWGVGKTYFWNEGIKQAKSDSNFCRSKYCYVSLFGIKSLEQLKSTLFQNLVDKSQIGQGLSIENVRQNYGKLVGQSGRFLSQILPLIPGAKEFGAFLYSAAFTLVKDALICIDDFERKSPSLLTTDVLGLISFLKTECNCKVALIFSDANFDDGSKNDYAQFREKVVDVEVQFSPTPTESTALVFTSPSDIDTQLTTFANLLQISNIRILHRIKKAASITVPLLQKFDPQITQQALQTLTLFGWCYFSHDKHVPSYSYVTSFGYHGGKKTEEEQRWNALLQEYGFKATDELDVALRSVIEHGFLDEDLIRIEAEKIHDRLIAVKSVETFSTAWDRFYTFDHNEDEVVETFASLLKQHAMHVTPLNLNGMLLLLRELDRNELASELIDHYIRVRRENGEKAIFDLSTRALFGEKADVELERKFNLQMAALTETPTIENVLEDLAKNEGWSPVQEEVLASATSDDFYRIFKSATGKTLHSYVNASRMFVRFANASERQLAIAEKAKQALLRIASESLINKIRVKRYGICSEE